MESVKFRSRRIRISEQFHISADDMLAAGRKQQLEGVMGKRKDSLYEAGKRTGSWAKMRINRGQEFVTGIEVISGRVQCRMISIVTGYDSGLIVG